MAETRCISKIISRNSTIVMCELKSLSYKFVPINNGGQKLLISGRLWRR